MSTDTPRGKGTSGWVMATFVVLVIVLGLSLAKVITFGQFDLVLVLLIVVVGLSYSFDKLAVGSIISVQRQVKQLREASDTLREGQAKLKEQTVEAYGDLVSFVANSMNSTASALSHANSTSNSSAHVVIYPQTSPKEQEVQGEVERGESNQEKNATNAPHKESLAADILDPRHDLKSLRPAIGRQAVKWAASQRGIPENRLTFGVALALTDGPMTVGFDALGKTEGHFHLFETKFLPDVSNNLESTNVLARVAGEMRGATDVELVLIDGIAPLGESHPAGIALVNDRLRPYVDKGVLRISVFNAYDWARAHIGQNGRF